MLIADFCLAICLGVVGCGHGLVDVLGPSELQPLARSKNGILVTDNVL